MKHGFLPQAAEDVIRVYRENIRLVEELPKRYTGKEDTGGEYMSATSSAIVHQPHLNQHVAYSNIDVLPQPSWSQSFALSKGTKAELTIKGDVTKEGLELLKTYIELTIRALADETKPQIPNSTNMEG
jgi:hypothetical protein